MNTWWLVFGLLAWAIIFYVLFQMPQPGIADQGDFDRVMNVSGLELEAESRNDADFVRFLDYTTTDYKISDVSLFSLLDRLKATSMSYLITLVSLICLALGQDTFKTGYLAFVYALIYTAALYVIFQYLNITDQFKRTLFVIIAFFVFLDGNYLVWFNSLYGEPMMITTLMLYIAAWIYYIHHRHVLKSEDKVFPKILMITVAAFLFLGSKMQVISALPIIVIMLVKLGWDNRHLLKRYQIGLLAFLFCILIVYPVGLMNKEISKETQYNSVFYGILKDSKQPVQDLIDLGLNPDMAVEAGKHAFLDKAAYVRYVPHTQITEDEFYAQISNSKLVQFYITHPSRFIQGMAYTANQAFITSTFLGKYDRNVSETPVREFHRFTLWSVFRENQLPKTLWFLIPVYIGVLTMSLLAYAKNQGLQEMKARIELFWSVMFIGLIQFPMPFVGNGQADTSKQLYLFNFVFDMILVVSICWCFNQLINFFHLQKNSKLGRISYPET